MMDSQELNQVANIDATVVNDEQTEVSAEVTPRKVYTSKQELLDRVKELAHGEENPEKDEVDYLKTAFYKLMNCEREANLRDYLNNGGNVCHVC